MAGILSPHNSSSSSVDPNSGFCRRTKTYHSLRPAVPLPPPSHPLTITACVISLLRSPSTPTSAALDSTAFLIDAATGRRLTFSAFLRQVGSLTSSLRSPHLLRRNDVAFLLAPSSLHLPVVYLSLLSLGVVVSPSNPLSTPSELAHQIHLCKPTIAFTTSSLAHKLLPNLPALLLDSPEFISMLESTDDYSEYATGNDSVVVNQSDTAAIFYSSGTTGKLKGVVLTHRNLTARIAGLYHAKLKDDLGNGASAAPVVSLFTLPLFHIFGFCRLISVAAQGETAVLMEKFNLVRMLEAVEKYKVMFMPVSPALVVAMTKSNLMGKYDLSSLRRLSCGGAPLGKEVAEHFRAKIPHVVIYQGYGLTETAAACAITIGIEADKVGSVGRLAENMEAKIVDPDSRESLPPGQRGELCLRGPTIMKGYAGDDAATAATLDSEAWLKTGDLCYFDSEGYLFIVDRLKEIIKYKGYQVPPAELEQVLQSIPDIADAAVIPYPDDEAGQIPMAYIVRNHGFTVSATEIIDFVAKQVAPYKKIRRVEFIDSIPKSPIGKILRWELVNHALSRFPS